MTQNTTKTPMDRHVIEEILHKTHPITVQERLSLRKAYRAKLKEDGLSQNEWSEIHKVKSAQVSNVLNGLHAGTPVIRTVANYVLGNLKHEKA